MCACECAIASVRVRNRVHARAYYALDGVWAWPRSGIAVLAAMVSCRASLISLAVVSVLVLQGDIFTSRDSYRRRAGLYIIIFLSCSPSAARAQGQLNCYATGFPCDSSISTGFVVVNTFGECCTLPEANLVQSSPGVETCETCRGWPLAFNDCSREYACERERVRACVRLGSTWGVSPIRLKSVHLL